MSFLKERSRLCGKLTPMRRACTYVMVAKGSVGAYAQVGTYAKVGAYASFKKLASGWSGTPKNLSSTFVHLQADVDFKGYYSLVCAERCAVDFHAQCWRRSTTTRTFSANSASPQVTIQCRLEGCQILLDTIYQNGGNIRKCH
jgi:hypothetical protein